MDLNTNFDRNQKLRMNNQVYRGNMNRQNTMSHLNMNVNRRFDKEKFDQGTQYFKTGGKLENASQEQKSNMQFLEGFARAERLDMIRNKKTRI